MAKQDKKQAVKQEQSKDLIELLKEDAEVLRANEQNILKYKMRIADLELTIANFTKEKNELLDLVRTENDAFVANARKFAVKNGIDPDGEPSKARWNLDTTTMTFQKLQ